MWDPFKIDIIQSNIERDNGIKGIQNSIKLDNLKCLPSLQFCFTC